MRRHPPSSSNNSSSRGPRATNPLLLCGVALLLFAIWRVCSIHGDLHELHESLNKPSSGPSAQAAPADVQVIMPEDEDVLFRNATNKPLKVILAYPHVDECRQCSVCVPQSLIDQRLGNSSNSSRGWWGRLWARQLLAAEQQQQEQQQEQQVVLDSSSSGHSANSGSNAGSRGRRRRHTWLQRQQQWLAALASTSEANSSSTQPPSQLKQDQQQQQQWRRQLQQQQQHQQQQQRRPRLDGVKTHKAWLAKQAAGVANTDTLAVPGIQVILDMPDNSFTWQGSKYHIGPSSLQMDQRKIRHCKVCRGCRDLLQPMPKGIHWLGGAFLHDPGASDGWLSTAAAAATPTDSTTSQAVVKVWCTPVPKPGSRVPAVCKPSAIREQLQLLLALQNIAEGCQLGELLPHTWIGPVDGILPGSHGYRVHWDGLWSHLEVGVSAENLVHRGDPRAQPGLLLDYLQHKVNSTQVILAAVFDLLFSQCDRHGQNLYLKPGGSLVLIDNDQSYGASWRPCGVDSLFLPGTQKFEVERLGYSYVMKKPEYAPPKSPRPSHQVDPLQLLDYRCHLPPGQDSLGTHYPKPVTTCLKRLARMTPGRIAAKHGYPHPRMAAAVHQRAQDLLAHGFEWTLQNGWPRNPLPMRYKWAKGCCQMRRRQRDSSGSSSDAAAAGSSSGSSGAPPGDEGPYECTKWVQEELGWHTDLPIGDPVSGMAWEHNGVDTGSYSLSNEWDPVADPSEQEQQPTAPGF